MQTHCIVQVPQVRETATLSDKRVHNVYDDVVRCGAPPLSLNSFTLVQGQPFTVTLQEFTNFFEVFVREPTTKNDLGIYETDLVLNTGPQVPELQFFVTPYSKYIYETLCVCGFFCVFFSHNAIYSHFIRKIVLCPAIHIPPGGVDDWAQDYTASTYTDYL